MIGATRIRDNKAVAFVCLWTMAMNSTVAIALSPALPFLGRELGDGADGSFIAQMIQTLPSVAMIVAAALAGYAVQWLGRRKVMLVCSIVFTLAGVSGLVAPNLPVLAALRFTQGLASGAMVTLGYPIVAEYFTGEARNRLIGYCAAFGAASTIGALALAGPMVDAFGWRSVFALYAPGLLTVPMIWRHMHRNRPVVQKTAPLSWKPILAVWPIWLVQIVYTIGMYMSVIQVPFIAADKGIMSGSTISLLIATTSLFATIAAVLHGRVRKVLDYRGVFAMISFAYGAGLLICVGAHGLGMFLVGTAVLGIGAGSVEPAIISRALNETPSALHDRASGACMGTNFAGQFLNPIAAHPLVAIGGIQFAAASFGFGYLAAGLAFLIALMVAGTVREPLRAH